MSEVKESDRRKYNPGGTNEYSTPKEKPPRYDLRRKHKIQDDPLDNNDDIKEDKIAMENKTSETAKRMARKVLAAKNEELVREGLEGFKFKDQGIKSIANTYKHLAKAFMELSKANHIFVSCKSSQISPDGKMGGKGYVISIKEIRESFGTIMNAMSGLIDTFHDEVNSPYLKKTILEDNPIIKSILTDAEDIIDKAEDIEKEDQKLSQKDPSLTDDEKEKVKAILENKWK
jgi:hypothetical protein